MWPSDWRLYNNYQSQLDLIQFDFYHGARFLLIYATEQAALRYLSQSRRYVYLQVGRLFRYNGRVSRMIRDDEGEQRVMTKI